MAYTIDAVLKAMTDAGASNTHIKARTPVYFRTLDRLEKSNLPAPSPQDVEGIVMKLLDDVEKEVLRTRMQVDTLIGWGNPRRRFRILIFRQRDTLGMVIRNVPDRPPTTAEIGLPALANELLGKRRGIVLVTGPATSGKTTTVAAILNKWIREIESHIVTLEDPIEYIFESDRSLVTQRQVGDDTGSYLEGLRRVLRQDPDIIFVGELSSMDTISTALAASETGHLVISTLHAPTTATAIDQIVGAYPARSQENARLRLSVSLQGVLSQVLVPTRDNRRQIAVFEILTPSEGMRNFIRLNETFRIEDSLDTTPNCISFKKSSQLALQKGIVTAAKLKWILGSRSGIQ